MEFNNKLYKLRKQKGFSQDELANKLNVSRQTISKWELGDSTPELEKLIALSDLFEISLDELVLGKAPESNKDRMVKISGIGNVIIQKILTDENNGKVKKAVKIIGIIMGFLLIIDLASMLFYFLVNGFPN